MKKNEEIKKCYKKNISIQKKIAEKSKMPESYKDLVDSYYLLAMVCEVNEQNEYLLEAENLLCKLQEQYPEYRSKQDNNATFHDKYVRICNLLLQNYVKLLNAEQAKGDNIDLEKLSTYYINAIKYGEKAIAENITQETELFLAGLYQNAGNISRMMGKNEEAEKYFKKNIAIQKKYQE